MDVLSRKMIPHNNFFYYILEGNSIEILLWTTFQKLCLPESLLGSYAGGLVCFAGEQVKARGHIVIRRPFSKHVIGNNLNPSYENKYPVLKTGINTIRANQWVAL
jgi:hypothetical protein